MPKKWKYVVQRRTFYEQNISDQPHSCLEIMDLIVKVCRSKTVSQVDQFYPQLIRELIVSLHIDFNDSSSLD